MDVGVSYINYENKDGYILDAYSKTIAGVASRVSQSVVHIQVDKKMRDPRTNKILRQHRGRVLLFRRMGILLPTTM